MARPGPRTSGYIDRAAANTLKLARIRTGLSQRQLAAAAGVPHSTVARIESGAMNPSYALLQRIVIGSGLEMRTRLEPYDDHDDVLDNLAALDPEWAERAKRGADAFAARMKAAQ